MKQADSLLLKGLLGIKVNYNTVKKTIWERLG